MSIPFNTSRISVIRPNPADEPYEPAGEPAVVVSGIRAVISRATGAEAVVGGDQEIVHWKLDCDPCDINHHDQVRDDDTGDVYQVVWARLRRGLGLDHVEAGLRQVEGVASTPRGI